MKHRTWLAGVAVLTVAAGLLAGCTNGDKGTAPSSMPAIAQKLCPVMGVPINKDVYTDYNGRRVYFCCPACIDAFKKEPDKYLKKIDEQMKAAPAMPAAPSAPSMPSMPSMPKSGG